MTGAELRLPLRLAAWGAVAVAGPRAPGRASVALSGMLLAHHSSGSKPTGSPESGFACQWPVGPGGVQVQVVLTRRLAFVLLQVPVSRARQGPQSGSAESLPCTARQQKASSKCRQKQA